MIARQNRALTRWRGMACALMAVASIAVTDSKLRSRLYSSQIISQYHWTIEDQACSLKLLGANGMNLAYRFPLSANGEGAGGEVYFLLCLCRRRSRCGCFIGILAQQRLGVLLRFV